jgi:multidrug efflux pump subunit AcrB
MRGSRLRRPGRPDTIDKDWPGKPSAPSLSADEDPNTMWLVNLALRRPYTVWVGMLLVTVLGIVSYYRTPTDILPNLKVPVVVVFASYRGMPAPDMEKSVTTILERALTKCDHLEHIESRSLLGIGVIQVFFRPEVDPDIAASQVSALVSSEMQNLPPGMLFPTILKFDASAIPVGNLVISSNSRDDKELLDLADHEIKDAMAGIEGLASAPVFGGVFRQVQIYVDPQKLEALKLSPMEVARQVNAQSQVLPTGEMRIGPQIYYVSSNSMVDDPKKFASVALRSPDGRKVVFLGDIAEIKDDARLRTNTVRVDGRRAVYMPLLRQAGASAVAVVDNIKDFLPRLHEEGRIPDDVDVEVAFDQSQYVRDALANLRLEGVMGAVLASLVVLLFLGNLRSTFIVALSIPLSILAAFLGLYLTGHTINIMTLGGIALVLGRVVDDSIVDVENTVRHLGMGKTPLEAARDSAAEIAVPIFMATVTTVVVFLPLVFMSGVGKYLFTPLAVSAGLAMAASYLVSRTVSPLYCSRYLRSHEEREGMPVWLLLAGLVLAAGGLGVPILAHRVPAVAGPFLNLPQGAQRAVVGAGAVGGLFALVVLLFWISPLFDRLFTGFTAVYERSLRFCLRRRLAVVAALAACLVGAYLCFYKTGQELFPEVDASEFTIHLRASGGPRVETTENQVAEIEQLVREVVPPEDLNLMVANVGLSSRWSAVYTSNNGPHAAFLRVQLRSGFAGRHTPVLQYVAQMRKELEERYPQDDFFFETGGMIRRILNSGAVAPIEVQVHGKDEAARRIVARRLDRRLARIPQVKDTYLPQGMDLPQLRIAVDRTQAARLKLTEADVVRNVVAALMSSAQLAPNFWIDPKSGNPYLLGVQYPERLLTSKQVLEDIPLTPEGGTGGRPSPLLKQVATVERTQAPVEVYHYKLDRVSQIFVNVGDNDLARVAAEVERIARRLPEQYALASLSEERYEELRRDEDFRDKLREYYKTRDKALRADLMKHHGVDPTALAVPKGVLVTVRGEVKSMRDSFAEMAFNLTLAVLLVYLVMAAQFSSWLDPLITIVSAPLGLIGVAYLLRLTHTSLNIQSCMGILMMIGISVSNSVLVVEFANRQREAGLSIKDAIISASRVRLRPILMTTLATVVGLLPMAIHLHPGDEMNLPLARAVIGGLASSTLLTLFVVPVLYVMLKPRQGPVVRQD